MAGFVILIFEFWEMSGRHCGMSTRVGDCGLIGQVHWVTARHMGVSCNGIFVDGT